MNKFQLQGLALEAKYPEATKQLLEQEYGFTVLKIDHVGDSSVFDAKGEYDKLARFYYENIYKNEAFETVVKKGTLCESLTVDDIKVI